MTQPQRTLLAGKVAKILNDRELVINKGTKDGLQLGDKFKLMELSDEILDPDTQESLGSMEREIIRVKIVHVERLMAIAHTYETYNAGGHVPEVGISGSVTVVRTLRRPGSPFTDDYLVKIGDELIQFEEEKQ